MTHSTENQPPAFYPGQDSSGHIPGGAMWQGNGASPRPPSDAYPAGDEAAHREGPEGERFMTSGLMRRYNR